MWWSLVDQQDERRKNIFEINFRNISGKRRPVDVRSFGLCVMKCHRIKFLTFFQVLQTQTRRLYSEIADNPYKMERRFRVCFENSDVEKSFQQLLEHVCQLCLAENLDPDRDPDKPLKECHYKTFKSLEHHVKRNHELFFCELCVEHLKVKEEVHSIKAMTKVGFFEHLEHTFEFVLHSDKKSVFFNFMTILSSCLSPI